MKIYLHSSSIRDDTDLLVILLYHAEINAQDVFLSSEPPQGSSKNKMWSVKQSKELLGIDVCNNIFFILAILGCDTTSRLYGLESAWHKLKVMFCFANKQIFCQ